MTSLSFMAFIVVFFFFFFFLQTADTVLNIINNLAQVDAQELENAQTEDGAASRVTQTLENILLNLEVSANDSFRAVTSNVAAQVRLLFLFFF